MILHHKNLNCSMLYGFDHNSHLHHEVPANKISQLSVDLRLRPVSQSHATWLYLFFEHLTNARYTMNTETHHWIIQKSMLKAKSYLECLPFE